MSRTRVETRHVEPLCVRIAVAAAMLGVGRSTLYELIKAGDLETVRIGKSSLVLTRSIRALVGSSAA